MDKSSYETFEYLPNNSHDPEHPDQFFVVQDDGTFLINRQVQYVAQVQDVKDALDGVQSCTVYDITPQQFFVDVDSSSELISVPDNYILPVSISEGSNNIYGSSYFLQAVSNTEQAEDSVTTGQYKETDSSGVDIVSNEEKIDNSCTEITITDDQYKMLELKGWILLESNNKVFILDTMGLHDISTNTGLIRQLKSECQNNTDFDINDVNTILRSHKPAINTPTVVIDEQEENSCVEHDDLVIRKNIVTRKESTLNTTHVETIKVEEQKEKIPDVEQLTQDNKVLNENVYKAMQQRSVLRNPIKIKTDLLTRDIPDRIVLGRTGNGKKLVAKVMKPTIKNKEPDSKTSSGPKPKLITVEAAMNKSADDDTKLQIENLIKEAMHSEVECPSEHVAAAKEVIDQLLQLPKFIPSLIEYNLVVTKEVSKDQKTKVSSVVTGRVTSSNGINGSLHFEYIPCLLKNIMYDTESPYKPTIQSNGTKGTVIKMQSLNEQFSYLHVHVTETRREDDTMAVSITLNKRHLPEMSSNEEYISRKPRSAKLFACSSCASIFNTELELTVHQETYCSEADDTLTIDTETMCITENPPEENEKLDPTYYIVKSSNGTQYACLQCSVKFNKLGNCLRHMKIHKKLVNIPENNEILDNSAKDSNNSMQPMFKCKMCTSSYFHSATLSKHIVAAHIRVNNKNKCK